MANWRSRLTGTQDAVPVRPALPDGAEAVVAPPAAVRADGSLSAAQTDFLVSLIEPPAVRELDELPEDDRAFLEGIRKRLETRELELPVLPEVAIRLSRMMQEGVLVSEYVALLTQDPVLATEVLKTANSAFYGMSVQMTSLQDAVVRIGLIRLQSILMFTQMRAKVSKGSVFQVEATLLLDMSLPMALLSGKVARQHATAQDLCFMRGLLSSVEHLVIAGAVGEISRGLRRALSPSVRALHEAFVRFGAEVRHAVASEWNLTDLLIGAEDRDTLSAELDMLRRALVCRRLGRPQPPAALPPDKLEAALDDVQCLAPWGQAPCRVGPPVITLPAV